MRLIDADALLKASRRGKVLYFDDTTTDGYTDVLLAVEVERAPTINAEPVKHGTWELKHIGYGHYWECSCCQTKPDIYITKDTNYCPHCGAKMNGG